MRRYRNVLNLIRGGYTSADIIREFGHLAPSRLRRLMRSKRLAEGLAVQREFAAGMLPHRLACYAEEATVRLLDVADDSKSDAARRAAEKLLAEGKRHLGAPTLGLGEPEEDECEEEEESEDETEAPSERTE